jgi:hypothetical protein
MNKDSSHLTCIHIQKETVQSIYRIRVERYLRKDGKYVLTIILKAKHVSSVLVN